MLRTIRLAIAALVLSGACTGLAAAGPVSIVLRDGRVTLVARQATIREILIEWARVGGVRIVNAERVPGGPVTLELTSVPEADALRVVLRSMGGYLAAPRRLSDSRLSVFDRIVVLPQLAPTTVPQVPPPDTRQLLPSTRQPYGPDTPRGGMFRRRTDSMNPDGDEDADQDDVMPNRRNGRDPRQGSAAGSARDSSAVDEDAKETTQRPQTFPGPTTPGGSVSRPGMMPPPAKPPGENH